MGNSHGMMLKLPPVKSPKVGRNGNFDGTALLYGHITGRKTGMGRKAEIFHVDTRHILQVQYMKAGRGTMTIEDRMPTKLKFIWRVAFLPNQ